LQSSMFRIADSAFRFPGIAICNLIAMLSRIYRYGTTEP
jgi:hypothetical protein